MQIQNSRPMSERGLDAYFTPPEAVIALLRIEAGRIPSVLWEPAAGDGAIVRPLRKAGFTVFASDIADYGCPDCICRDYFGASAEPGVTGIVTNPPYRFALSFVLKAIAEAPYVAFLLRTNFLESVKRKRWLFDLSPPARIWISSRRLPMMHRVGWEGPHAPSSTCHAWFIWERRWTRETRVKWFDWKDC
jgi:hypothetical protein